MLCYEKSNEGAQEFAHELAKQAHPCFLFTSISRSQEIDIEYAKENNME